MTLPLRRRALAVSAVAAGLALVLSGCITIQASPATAPTTVATDPAATTQPAPTSTPGDALACVDDVVTITGSDIETTFADECATVVIEGTDLDVDLDEARIGSVQLRGDRIEVDAAQLEAVEIQGQENEVDVDGSGALSIAGDRNDVDVDGDLGAVAIAGNDNKIDARSVGDVVDSGDRNRIE